LEDETGLQLGRGQMNADFAQSSHMFDERLD
jgi:hypothetical protein